MRCPDVAESWNRSTSISNSDPEAEPEVAAPRVLKTRSDSRSDHEPRVPVSIPSPSQAGRALGSVWGHAALATDDRLTNDGPRIPRLSPAAKWPGQVLTAHVFLPIAAPDMVWEERLGNHLSYRAEMLSCAGRAMTCRRLSASHQGDNTSAEPLRPVELARTRGRAFSSLLTVGQRTCYRRAKAVGHVRTGRAVADIQASGTAIGRGEMPFGARTSGNRLFLDEPGVREDQVGD